MSKSVRVGVGVILKRGNTVLLGKRAIDSIEEGETPKENNICTTWAIPGGKLELGETIEECAIRETFEETGITLKKLQFVALNDATQNFITIGFLSEEFDGEAKTTEPDKITDWQWFDLNTLPTPLFEPAKQTLRKYTKGILY